MRFVTAQRNNETFVGVVEQESEKVVHLCLAEQAMHQRMALPSSLLECIALGDEFLHRVNEIAAWVKENPSAQYMYDLHDVRLLAPIPRPSKNIFCIGKNYVDHAIERGSSRSSLVGDPDVRLPQSAAPVVRAVAR